MRKLLSIVTLSLLASCGASVPAYACASDAGHLLRGVFILQTISAIGIVLIMMYPHTKKEPVVTEKVHTNLMGFIDTNEEDDS